MSENYGPWDEFELVDGNKAGDVVGIRKKGEEGPIFTPKDFDALPSVKMSPEANEARLKMLAEAAAFDADAEGDEEAVVDEKEEEKKSGE